MGPVSESVLYRLVPLALVLAFLLLLRGSGFAATEPEAITLALGFMLMAAFVAGKGAGRVGLPRISGYLVAGVLIGPHVTNLLTSDMLAAGKAIEGIAVALIALTAGGEIRMDWLRREIRSLSVITLLQIALVGAVTFSIVFFGRDLFPFMAEVDRTTAAVIALSLAAIAISNSPTVTIAVISENRAEGPLSRTVLGVVVLVDLCVILLFTVTLAFARDVLGGGAEAGSPLVVTLLRHTLGSIAAGCVFGIGISIFLRRVGREIPVFVLAVCFVIWQTAEQLHLEALLIALAAGFWVENFSAARGEHLIKGIERVSLPVYALFFATAGAKVDLGALTVMGPLALLLASARAGSIWLGTRLGAAASPVAPVVKRYAWLGLISQAGVTLALAAILARTFPEWGAGIQTLIVAMIALHELVGPIGFQYGLRRAGEIGATASAPRPPESRDTVPG